MRFERAMCVMLIAAVPAVSGQMQDNERKTLKCDSERSDSDQHRFCEIREQTVPVTASLIVDATPNGGISVLGWSRNEVLVRARVNTRDSSDPAAKDLASQVTLETSGGRIAAHGPSQNGSRKSWSVTFEVFVPHATSLQLESENGGVRIADVKGNIRCKTVNGGLHLARLAGTVEGKTVNGGVHVELTGAAWDGSGLTLNTTNGGVSLQVPENYSAQVEASTVNGGMHSDFGKAAANGGAPRPPDGQRRNFSVTLGSGGAPIRVSTVNGGVHVSGTGSSRAANHI